MDSEGGGGGTVCPSLAPFTLVNGITHTSKSIDDKVRTIWKYVLFQFYT